MFRSVVVFVALAAVSAFAPASRVARGSALKMSVFPENPTGLPGDIAPTGFFDPAGLSNGKSAKELKMFREAEIKHGRVCMLATFGLLTQELLKNPLGIDGPAIRHFDIVDSEFPEFGEIFILLCAFIEGWSIKKRYEPKGSEFKGFLLDTVEAGDLSWDPLGWYPTDPTEQAIIKTKELQNGRLAMLSVAGIVLQEIMDGKEILCHFQKVCV